MQFMSNYTSAAAFRQPLEKQNGERENLKKQENLLAEG